MSINSVNFMGSYLCFSGSPLSESTKRKLIALGIDPSTVQSEAEARALIEQILELRNNANVPLPFEEEKSKLSNPENKQTKENSENMISLLDYDSSLKRIILGL